MTGREQEILDLPRADPPSARQTLDEWLGIGRAAVAAHITQLTRRAQSSAGVV